MNFTEGEEEKGRKRRKSLDDDEISNKGTSLQN